MFIECTKSCRLSSAHCTGHCLLFWHNKLIEHLLIYSVIIDVAYILYNIQYIYHATRQNYKLFSTNHGSVDPDPGGKIFQIKTEKGKEIANNCNFIQFLK